MGLSGALGVSSVTWGEGRVSRCQGEEGRRIGGEERGDEKSKRTGRIGRRGRKVGRGEGYEEGEAVMKKCN